MKTTFYELYVLGEWHSEWRDLAAAKAMAESLEPDYRCVWQTDVQRDDPNLIFGRTKHMSFMIYSYTANYSYIESMAKNDKHPMAWWKQNAPNTPESDLIPCSSWMPDDYRAPIQFFDHWKQHYASYSNEYLLRAILENQQEQINILKQTLDSLKK